MQTQAEAAFLTRLAGWLGAGCIVEIGSWHGASAIALARGAAEQSAARRSMVYCIEPHAAFTGVYGGRFGPSDRTAFYRAMLDAGESEHIALINLPSLDAAKAWRLPIGLLFIDGDHSKDGVAADVEAWAQHLVAGGFIVFDDALDPAIGPSRAIARLIASGRYRKAGGEGKVIALQQVPAGLAANRATQRRLAIDAVKDRAVACGYDPVRAAARLGYGSFVSLARRYVYVETPKAACTTMKHFIATLEGVTRDPSARPYHRESRRDMRIHERRHLALPTLLDVPPEVRSAVFDGDPEWLVLALSRNPFSRLVSVFESKVRIGEPGYRHLEQRYGDRTLLAAAGANPRAAFAAFVDEIVGDPEAVDGDAHLRPQADLLMPRMIAYGRVFKVEALGEATGALSKHLERAGQSLDIVPDRLNHSFHPSWRLYYDASSAATVARVYAEDFAAFSYDPSDWQPPPGAPERFDEPDGHRAWRAEVVERNAMIDELYDLLPKL